MIAGGHVPRPETSTSPTLNGNLSFRYADEDNSIRVSWG